jgi:hypothetical protein
MKLAGGFAASGSSTRSSGSISASVSCGLAIDLLDDSSGYWFYWPMLGTGLGVLLTGVVLGGVGGLFGKDWERRQVDKYLGEQGDQGNGSDARA